MSHCHHEHCDHSHDDLPGSGEQFLLYSKIDLDNVCCLNEAEPNSGQKIIRPWNERMDDTKVIYNITLFFDWLLMLFFLSLIIVFGK